MLLRSRLTARRGIARVLFEVPRRRRDDVLRRLDRYAPLTAEKR
jgi:hypothetical protein